MDDHKPEGPAINLVPKAHAWCEQTQGPSGAPSPSLIADRSGCRLDAAASAPPTTTGALNRR